MQHQILVKQNDILHISFADGSLSIVLSADELKQKLSHTKNEVNEEEKKEDKKSKKK